MSLRIRVLGTAYLGLQAAGIVGWWCALMVFPGAREYFRASESPDSMLLAFWLPDLLVAALGSGLSAALVWRGSSLGPFTLAVTAGAMLYAALYCTALVPIAPETWPAAVLMLPAAAATTVFAWLYRCHSDR